jgi:hypothetical protein
MKSLKKIITNFLIIELLISSSLALSLLFTPLTASAQIVPLAEKTEVCQGINANGSNACDTNAVGTLNTTLGEFITIFSVIIGIITVIMVMVSGFKLITSNGDPNGVSSAKTTLIYALIGVLVVVVAQVLVHFVIYHAQVAGGGS